MPIEINTTYDRKRLLAFNDYIARFRVALWIYMAVCNLLVLGACVFMAIFNQMDRPMYFAAGFVIILDLMLVFMHFILPRVTVKKSRSLDTVIKYTFNEDNFVIDAQSTNVQEASTIKYDLIQKVRQNGGDIYLFISKVQGFIVDTSALEPAQVEQLRELLGGNIDSKKIRWAKK